MLDPVDVVIVGGGASAAAFAWSLADTRMRIVCLEQGRWVNSSEYPSNGRDWEERHFTDFSISPNRRKLPEDYPVNDDDSPIKIANYNAVGGGTILYAGHFPRFHPSDFRVRSLDGVADDWPVDYQTLEPFYALNDRMMGVSSLAGDPAYPPKEAVMPPIPMGRTGETLGRAMNDLGWHWWPSDSAIATQVHGGLSPCINLGHCGAGCAQGAKASTDITYWPEAMKNRVEVRTRCRASRIDVDDDGMARGVHYFDADNVARFQPAEIVVLACNGVGTPRLLLNSACERFPDGLANSSGQVGRNLMLHPYAQIRGRFAAPLDGYRGPHICCWSMQFYETDRSRGYVRGYSFQFSRGRGPVATAMNGMADGVIPWGEEHHAAFRRRFEHDAGMVAICEDLPEPENRVTLDPRLTDAHGIAAPRVTYRLSENSRKMLDHAVRSGGAILRAAGAEEIVSASPLPYAGWHLMGTARMGTDPRHSVTNEWGRTHDVRNLFIIDGSVFVTSGGVNPTSTIQALALYFADQIKTRIYELFE